MRREVTIALWGAASTLAWAWLVARDGQASDAPAAAPRQPRAPVRLEGWELIEGDTITLEPTRKYAATFQLGGLEKMFGGREDVADKLREYMDWLALDVWDDPAQVSLSFPSGATDVGGRFWAIGVPARRATIQRPRQIARLWSAPWRGFPEDAIHPPQVTRVVR